MNDSNVSDRFNNSSNETIGLDKFYFYEVEQFVVLSILFVAIVVGNVGVILTLFYAKTRKSRMNYFIKQLAIADLSVGLVNVLTDIVWRMTVSWHAGNLACKIIRYLQVVVTYASTYVLVALSIDRYDAVRNPMHFRTNWKRAKLLIAGAWGLSFTFSSPILLLYEDREIQGSRQCWIDLPSPFHWQVYMTCVALTIFLIPALIIVTCYVFILFTIWNKNREMVASSEGVIPRAKIKTVKVTLVIVSVFVACWAPYIIFDVLQVFGHVPNTQTNVALATFIQSLAPLNSAANPLIYFAFSTHVFKTLRKYRAFGCCRCGASKRDGMPSKRTRSSTDTASVSDTCASSTRNKSRLSHHTSRL